MRRVGFTGSPRTNRLAVVAMTVGACLCASGAGATAVDMLNLPVTSPNLCLACHVVAAPSEGDAGLNPFGIDYLANGRLWDPNLAMLDSDEDGCLNGVEVGDSDGDGFPDGNVTEQAGNPGVKDECGSGSLVDEKVWGTLKAMFDGR